MSVTKASEVVSGSGGVSKIPGARPGFGNPGRVRETDADAGKRTLDLPRRAFRRPARMAFAPGMKPEGSLLAVTLAGVSVRVPLPRRHVREARRLGEQPGEVHR